MSSKLSYEIVGDANVKDIAPAKRNIGEKAQQEKLSPFFRDNHLKDESANKTIASKLRTSLK